MSPADTWGRVFGERELPAQTPWVRSVLVFKEHLSEGRRSQRKWSTLQMTPCTISAASPLAVLELLESRVLLPTVLSPV